MGLAGRRDRPAARPARATHIIGGGRRELVLPLSARQAVLEEDLHARTQTTARGPRLEGKSAGTSRRQGRITKAGNAPARWIVGESAHHAFLAPKVSTQLTLRQQGLATQARELSWKIEVRRHKRGRHLRHRGVMKRKVTVARARELAGFVGDVLRQVSVPRP